MHEKPNETLPESSKNESIALKSSPNNGNGNHASEAATNGDAPAKQESKTMTDVEVDADGDVKMKNDNPPQEKEEKTAATEKEPEKEAAEAPPPGVGKQDEEMKGDQDTPLVKSEESAASTSSEPEPKKQTPVENPPEKEPESEKTQPLPALEKEAAAKAEAPSQNTEKTDTETASKKETQTHTEKSENPSASTETNGSSKDAAKKPDPAASTAENPPPPVMRGTLAYNTEYRRHIIRGMWNYENSNAFPSQRFELVRNLRDDEELTKLPMDGEFHGSFSLAYIHTTSKGKQKERSKLVNESGVNIKFEKVTDSEYNMTGKGTNQYGVFNINGKATPSEHEGDPVWNVEFRKRYEPGTAPAPSPSAKPNSNNNSKSGDAAAEPGPLPDPSPSYDTGVVCLRGTMVKHTSQDLGSTEMIHRITGFWSSGLNHILSDPTNTKGLLSKFEYEHKSTLPTNQFPVQGKYSGWFDLLTEDGSRTRINESNVTLKFKKNNAGYFNVDGKGSNVYGKYTITGTLTKDNIITIFRHFQPRKIKVSKSVTPPPPPINTGAPTLARRASSAAIIENPTLKLEDVQIPTEAADEKTLKPIPQPANATYSAVSRGVLKINEDGSHSCTGKWAVTREHFTSGQTSSFTVRLDAMYAKEAMEASNDDRQCPLDSAMYKGSFQLKKTGGRHLTIVDQQVVMCFRMNSSGSYNVYGKGTNSIGVFNLVGTLIMNGKNGGQVELYRMYPPELLNSPPAPAGKSTDAPSSVAVPKPKSGFPSAPPQGLVRRESTRTVKLPSRLEDDDPSAQLGRIMDRCNQILRVMREKDVESGAFFSDPVDPVALGIPTYHQIIKEPMDLRTIARNMDNNQISSPEEFARLVRLVFENAMKFNEDPAHSVHQAARNLLILFNQKFRDVERLIQNFRRAQGDDKKESKKKKKEPAKPKTVREIRYEEAQVLAQESAESMASLVAAAPSNSATVSRTEFSLLLRMIQNIQNQLVQTRQLIAALSPDEVEVQPAAVSDVAGSPVPLPTASGSTSRSASYTVSEKKKTAKRKAETLDEPVVMPDTPLTREEQELLTETINELPAEHLGIVIQIIREAAPVGADEEEIDLDIDQLSFSTQRKLWRYVSKVRIRVKIRFVGHFIHHWLMFLFLR